MKLNRKAIVCIHDTDFYSFFPLSPVLGAHGLMLLLHSSVCRRCQYLGGAETNRRLSACQLRREQRTAAADAQMQPYLVATATTTNGRMSTSSAVQGQHTATAPLMMYGGGDHGNLPLRSSDDPCMASRLHHVHACR